MRDEEEKKLRAIDKKRLKKLREEHLDLEAEM